MRGEGFQKPTSTPGAKEVGLAVISYIGTTAASCSCGWSTQHHRGKVLEDRIDTHLSKRHNGRGIRL